MASDLHSSAPVVATEKVHLVGGPLDGITDFLIPLHCLRIDLEDGTSYHFSSFATLHFQKETFIHSTLDPVIFAP